MQLYALQSVLANREAFIRLMIEDDVTYKQETGSLGSSRSIGSAFRIYDKQCNIQSILENYTVWTLNPTNREIPLDSNRANQVVSFLQKHGDEDKELEIQLEFFRFRSNDGE